MSLKLLFFTFKKQKTEMSQNFIVSVKFLKGVRDFDRNAANWQ
jgi:hypothetical protein